MTGHYLNAANVALDRLQGWEGMPLSTQASEALRALDTILDLGAAGFAKNCNYKLLQERCQQVTAGTLGSTIDELVHVLRYHRDLLLTMRR